jgi:hypothetical protein
MLQTEKITIQVTPEAAQAFRNVSSEDRKKLELLLSIHLLEAAKSRENLRTVMREISQNAKRRGLTPEILKDLLA